LSYLFIGVYWFLSNDGLVDGLVKLSKAF
jgi:hypothetical protein